MQMKRLVTISVCVAAACALMVAGCGGAAQNTTAPAAETTAAEATTPVAETTAAEETTAEATTAEETTAEETTEEEVTPAVGGWTVNTDTTPILTEEQTALFEQAKEGFDGVEYEPVAEIATQVVAGTNHAFLCKGTVVVPDAVPGWYIVVVYEDLQGGARIVSAEALDLPELAVLENVETGMDGAWAAVELFGESGLPAEAHEAFEEASQEYDGVAFSPIALLATQVVSGTNYKLLCSGTMVTEEPITSLYEVDIYEDLEGGVQIINADVFDLTAYINLMEQPEEETAEDGTGATVGGWTVNTDTNIMLTDEENNVFNTAMQKVMGVDYFPVSVVATQVVSGTNYGYLCTGTVVAPQALPTWYFITIYADLEGDAECIGIVEMDITDIMKTDEANPAGVGGWTVAPDGLNPNVLPEQAEAAFEKVASEGDQQISYTPIALLGTQVVSGTNYKILCYGATDQDTGLYALTIYEDLDGNATIEAAEMLNLTSYIGQH